MSRRLLDQVTLPLSGWTARVYQENDDPLRLVMESGRGSPLTHRLPARDSADRPVLGTHHIELARPFGPAAVGTITLAYGVLGDEPVEFDFLQYRPWRPARIEKVDALTLADRVWVAELAGQFDEVRARTSGAIAFQERLCA